MAFNFTETKYNRLLVRLAALEESFNNMVIAIDEFVTSDQVQELLTLFQSTVDDLSTTVTSLEERVEAIENEPLD